MKYEILISSKMRDVSRALHVKCVGMNHCIYELGRNIVVEVPKSDCEDVVKVLKPQFGDVVLISKAYLMLEDLHDFILVKQMISESPVFEYEDLTVPILEKQLVDLVSDKMYESQDQKQIKRQFQQAFETYNVNQSKMVRYASRKGKKEEVLDRIATLDNDRIATVKAIQNYLASAPFDKVWMFGSYSRMEERPDSDIDLLVQMGKSSEMGLLELSGIIMGLESVAHRSVDLVLDGSVKPFAKESIERDKVLIYERGR